MTPVKHSRPRPAPGGRPEAAPAKEPIPSLARLALFLAIALAALIGPSIYFASVAEGETRRTMRSLCKSEQPCRDAVAMHFDSSWDSNAGMGLLRRRVEIDREGLVDCVNEAAGARYFTYNEQRDYIGTPEP